jgi:hypothetical protein
MKNILFLSFGVLALLSACAKDKSVDDYQRDKLQKNLALYQSVAGSYSGVVTSQENGDVLGAMELSLRAEVTPVDSKDGETAVATPILVGSVRFLDQNIISLSAPNGYYDPATGLYSADIKITRAGSGGEGGGGAPGAQETETVKITGYIGGESLSGSVHALDYPGHGGSFQLTKNRRESLQEQLRRARPGQGRESDQLVAFAGTTYFQKTQRPVHIVALRPNRGTAEDFLDLVNPVKKVQLSLNYSNSLAFLFQNAVFDTRQDYITGETTVTVKNGPNQTVQKMNIECSMIDEDLRCSHISSGLGQVATSEAKKTRGPMQNFPDAPEDRQSVTKIFYGKGRMPSDKKDRTMELRVVYPARSRTDALIEDFFPTTEKLLQVSVVFADSVTQSFTGVKWDTLNGLLDGNADRTSNSGSYTAYVQCHNFFFLESKEKFACNYWTTRSPLISIEFTPPYKQ